MINPRNLMLNSTFIEIRGPPALVHFITIEIRQNGFNGTCVRCIFNPNLGTHLFKKPNKQGSGEKSLLNHCFRRLPVSSVALLYFLLSLAYWRNGYSMIVYSLCWQHRLFSCSLNKYSFCVLTGVRFASRLINQIDISLPCKMSYSFKIVFVLLRWLKGSFSKLQEINCVLNKLQIQKT